MKKIVVGLVLLVSACSIALIFWNQELKYSLPTPVPAAYKATHVNEHIDLSALNTVDKAKAVYFHFFNPECPCSRFNLQHFNSLVKEFNGDVQIYAVIPAFADVEHAKSLIDNDAIQIIQDTNDSLATACGVYSTPQAVIIDANQRLYYRGNYNKARYCTMKESNYAQLALRQLVQGHEAPVFSTLATESYGCELPSENKNNTILLNIIP